MSLKNKIFLILLITGFLALLIRTFLVEGFIVRGDSMSPTILSGDYVFVNKLAYVRGEPERGDVIVAIPRGESFKVIKRVIVLPGERFSIEGGQVVIRNDRLDTGISLEEDYLVGDLESMVEGVQIKLDVEEYFVLGDNSSVSIDSRKLGFLDRWRIKGRVFGILRLKSFKYISL